jgi:antitoxin YefM
MATTPVTELRDQLSEAIDEVNRTGTEWIITRHGRPVAVLLAYEEYESLVETLNILSDSDTMAAIEEARAEDDDEA